MQFRSRASLLVGLMVLAVSLVSGGSAQGQGAKKGNSKTYSFKSYDGVELSGTFYPSAGGKREAVVLLLHGFDLKKGGSSHQDGWDDLAASLQADGFAVFSFDFRGFGNSKSVDKDRFWKVSENFRGIRRRGSDSIDHKDFSPSYLSMLVNDIAAAKAFLDKMNDARQVNSASVVVVGAAEGATLGAMWLANECRRKKDKSMFIGALPTSLGDAEIGDIVCGVWLSISPRLGSRIVSGYLSRWLVEAGQKNKVPMYFLYGAKDPNCETLARNMLSVVKPKLSKISAELKNTGLKGVPDARFVGSQLLDRDLETGKFIKQYIEQALDARGARAWSERKVETSRYFYIIPNNRIPRLNKELNQEVPSVDVSQFLR